MLEVCVSMYLVVQDLVTFLKLTAYIYKEQIGVTKITFHVCFEILAGNLQIQP